MASASESGATSRQDNLRRLFAPRHLAIFGGPPAEAVVHQCRAVGYRGEIWPVHPRRETLAGLPCYPDVASLPEAPDASFLAVPAEATVDVAGQLAARGSGGAVCHASGFAEAGERGAALQRELVDVAGDLALVGPNCYGVLNYLDGAALWPDQHGGQPVGSGVAIVTQSGNIGQNITMQRRALPLAHLVSVGNGAGRGVAEIVETLLDDPRVTAIGLHLEGIEDVAALLSAALRALGAGIPVVALKSGRSELGARANLGHTSSLATSDVLCDAWFARVGIARVYELPEFLETLKFLHVHGPLSGARVGSASCSGGEAALVADLAAEHDIELPEFPAEVHDGLEKVLGERVAVANPLDYHTYVWGDLAALTECFTHYLRADFDNHLLVLDLPRADRCTLDDWHATLEAFRAASRRTGSPASVVNSLPDGLPEETTAGLLGEGIAALHGLREALRAVRAAAVIGAAAARQQHTLPPATSPAPSGPVRQLDEIDSKRVLARAGVPVPQARAVPPQEAVAAAEQVGYPVVLKALSDGLAHKTENGAVRLDLRDAGQVRAAATELAALSPRLLVERMTTDAVAELLVGVHHDATFGPVLTIGAGGVLVELVRDVATVPLPAARNDLHAALGSLRTFPLLRGYRRRQSGDLPATLDAIEAIADHAVRHAGRLRELDVNPLLVRPDGKGAVAVDALLRVTGEPRADRDGPPNELTSTEEVAG